MKRFIVAAIGFCAVSVQARFEYWKNQADNYGYESFVTEIPFEDTNKLYCMNMKWNTKGVMYAL